MPEGCRPIPAGHFNFDPALALARGGRDGVAQAIIHEKINGWLLHYQKRGRDYVYNNIDQWAEQLPFWHKGTVRKHIHELVECGYLDRERPGINAPSYYKQPVTKESDGETQMLLWGEEKSLTVATKADHLQDINSTTHKPSRANHQPPTPTARARKPLNGGGVAIFSPPAESRDLPEKKLATVERREITTEGDDSPQPFAIEETNLAADATIPTPSSALPPPVSEEICLIFHASMPDELARIGESRLRHELKYVERFNETATDKTRIANPAGYAISQCRKYPDRPTPLKKTAQEIQDEEWEAYKLTEDYRLNYRPYEPPGAPPAPEPPDHTGDTTEPDNVAEGLVMA